MTLRKTTSAEPAKASGGSSSDGPAKPTAKAPKKTVPKASKRAATKKMPPKPVRYAASLYPPKRKVPVEFVAAVEDLEEALGQPVILLVQAANDSTRMGGIFSPVVNLVRRNRKSLAGDQEPAIVIHSDGGVASSAYRLSLWASATFGAYTAVVPARAMSAATLLTIGAERIVMGRHAELGPLDVQRWNPGTNTMDAALDEVHSLQHLRDFSLDAVAMTDAFFKKLDMGYDTRTMLPPVFDFVAKSLQPIYEKVDAVHWSGATRAMKEAQEYAKRLLKPIYGATAAQRIARNLVEEYPTHGFVISPTEALELGLNVDTGDDKISNAVDRLYDCIDSRTVIGKLVPLKEQQ